VSGRLLGWSSLVGALILISYAGRAAGGKPDRNAVYHYGLAVGGIIEYALVLVIVLAIAAGPQLKEVLALRPPKSWPRALGVAALVLVAIYVFGAVLDPYLHAGREQGLTPTGWQPSHAAAFAANFVVIAVVAPVVEELTFRGLGYSLLAPFGTWTAILGTGLLFGLAHGLVEGLPILAAFGVGLAIVRSRSGSVYPGMLLHSAFNAIALVVSVTT
jgi:membrane protease YdiL (CAAX protease family)